MATFQSILRMSTSGFGCRAKATGWCLESGLEAMLEMHRRGDGVKKDRSIAVGLLPSQKPVLYPTILHALADGFKLLAPPTKDVLMGATDEAATYEWNWWLVRDEEHSERFGTPNLAKMKRELREAAPPGRPRNSKKVKNDR